MNEQPETEQFKKMELFNHIMEYGYTAKEAEALVEFKFSPRCRATETNRELYNYTRLIPVRLITGWDDLTTKQRRKVLWELGINPYGKVDFSEDVCCYRWGDKVECGRIVIGDERQDKAWLNKRVNGKLVASDEVKYKGIGRTNGKGMWGKQVDAVKNGKYKETDVDKL